jgi:hypothetical protein
MIWILTTGRDEPGELLAILHASKRKMYTLNQKMQGHTMAEQTEIWHRALKRDVEAYNRACEAR